MTKEEAFSEFIGQCSFEDDAGWSKEVFDHGYMAGLNAAQELFKKFGDIPLTGAETAIEIGKLR
jgi:hypothetical protein